MMFTLSFCCVVMSSKVCVLLLDTEFLLTRKTSGASVIEVPLHGSRMGNNDRNDAMSYD